MKNKDGLQDFEDFLRVEPVMCLQIVSLGYAKTLDREIGLVWCGGN